MKHLRFLLIINLLFVFSCSNDSSKEINSTEDTVERSKIDTLKKESAVLNNLQKNDSVKSNTSNSVPQGIEENYKPHPGKTTVTRRGAYDSIGWARKMYYDSINRLNK